MAHVCQDQYSIPLEEEEKEEQEQKESNSK